MTWLRVFGRSVRRGDCVAVVWAGGVLIVVVVERWSVAMKKNHSQGTEVRYSRVQPAIYRNAHSFGKAYAVCENKKTFRSRIPYWCLQRAVRSGSNSCHCAVRHPG